MAGLCLTKCPRQKGGHCYHTSCIKCKTSLVVAMLGCAPLNFCKLAQDGNGQSRQADLPLQTPLRALLERPLGQPNNS